MQGHDTVSLLRIVIRSTKVDRIGLEPRQQNLQNGGGEFGGAAASRPLLVGVQHFGRVCVVCR